jgi:hypothetical protein
VRDFGRSRETARDNPVPLFRYFFFVGVLLLVTLFVTDWYLDESPQQTFFREAQIDKSIIRIKSVHKWPERINFDTNLPTIVPPTLSAQTPIFNKPREAFAQLNARSQEARKPSSEIPRRRVAKHVRVARIEASQPIAERVPAGW